MFILIAFLVLLFGALAILAAGGSSEYGDDKAPFLIVGLVLIAALWLASGCTVSGDAATSSATATARDAERVVAHHRLAPARTDRGGRDSRGRPRGGVRGTAAVETGPVRVL